MIRTAFLVAIAVVMAMGADQPPPPLSVGELTTSIAPLITPDGQADLKELDALLRSINRRIAASEVLPRPNQDLDAASTERPLDGAGWRLWAFWAMDVPECEGLASELVRVRASQLASIRPVHLAGLRAWEGWLFRMNDYREGVWAAVKAQNRERIEEIHAGWKAEMAVLSQFAGGIYAGGVPLVNETRQAEVLGVDQVPCLRLISPVGRVHSLSGFAPGVDLVDWVRRCQAWEAQADRQGGRP